MTRSTGNNNLRLALSRLDRFARDGLLQTTTNAHHGLGKTPEMMIPPLNNLLKEWKQEYLTSLTKDTYGRDELISPFQMVKKLDAWKENSPFVKPDGRSYSLVLETAAEAAAASSAATPPNRSSQDIEQFNLQNDLLVADHLLQRLVSESQTDYSLKPTPTSFVKVMNAWAQSQQDHRSQLDPTNNAINDRSFDRSTILDASSMIERWIQCMHRLNEEGWPDTQPNLVMYNVLLNSLAKSGDINRMEHILSRMIQGEIDGISPDTVSFTTLIKAYSNERTSSAAEKAESLLLQMEELYDNGIYSVRPNNITYTTVIESHVKSGAENAGEKAEAVLRRMEKRFLMNLNTNDEVDVDIDPDMKPDIQAYNTVLAGYANTDKPEKAEELLMSILSSDGPLAVEPNHVSLNTVMSGWARRGDYDRAEGLLMKMHKLHIGCSLHTKPDVISYNTVLDALAKAGKRSRDKEESRRLAKRGSDILAHMECLYEDSGDANVKPNSRTYNTCINIFAKAGMIDEADALLQTFTKVAEDGVESSVVDGKPTVRTHNTLLSACMIRGQVAMAMSFWRRMKDQGIESDVVTYNTLLKCHARALSRKPPVDRQRTVKSARYIMQELKRENVIRPNQITYAAFVDVLLLNNEAEAAQEYLFGLLKDNSDKTRKNRASGPNPDRSVFHRILAEYGRKKTPRKAESLLHMMSDQSIEYGVDLHPNTETYNLLLRCWSESGDREAGERASMIVRFMQDSSIDGAIKVDIESYIQTLLSWRNSGDLTALNNIDSLILEMLLKQDRDLLPNEECYDIWLDAIADSNVVNKRQKVRDAMKSMKVHNFVPKGRLKKKIEQLLEDCCE